MCNWVIAAITSAFCWASADTAFDVILENEETELPQRKTIQNNPHHLTHSQTMFLCAITTYFIIFSYGLYIEINWPQYLNYTSEHPFFSSPLIIVILIFSGIFSYYHYHFIIKAFENSSSTIILPFLQFSSIFAFIFSIFQNYLSNRPYLSSYLHLLAYFLILLGGLAPATEGNLVKIFKPTFWKQPFVRNAIISDMSHAIYTNIVSYAGQGENQSIQFNFFSNMEFFILTRIMFVILFFFKLYRNKQVQNEILQLLKKSFNVIFGTIIGEVMTLIGYFSSVYGYQCYYQAGVVSASESSMNLIINLFLAFLLKKYLNIGKKASLHNLGLKIVSSVTISIGLTIATV